MKKINLLLGIAITAGVISCSKDDDSAGGLVNVDPNPVEDTVLDVNAVSQGITVNGAIKNSGAAPAPSGDITFTPNSTNQSAFLNNGFDIRLTVPDNYAGSYLVVVQENNTQAGEYIDIPASAGRSTTANSANAKKNSIIGKASRKLMDNEIEIDVDFDEAVTPGKFCYLLCIYDAAGNVSEPTEICVEVEAWGGNQNLVGSWNFSKAEYTYGTETETQVPGVEDCGESTLTCSNQTEINIENAYCDTLNSLVIVFNADGTYRFDSDETYTDYNYEASREACEAVFNDTVNSTSYSKGQWAYDEEEKILTLVEFEYQESDFNNGEPEIIPNGDLLFSGSLQIDGSSFNIFEEDDFQGENEVSKVYFSR